MSNIVKAKSAEIERVMNGLSGKFEKALGETIGVERFIQMSLDTCRKNPKLLECTTASLVGCLFTAATLGLNPALKECWMIPRKNGRTGEKDATFQMGYIGTVRMARRSGLIKSIQAMPVYEGEFFKIEYGTKKKLIHRPNPDPVGEPILYYSIIEFTNGGIEFLAWSKTKMEGFRKRYSEGYKAAVKYGNDNPWLSEFPQMACKTMLLQIGKTQELSVEFSRAYAVDGQSGSALVRDLGDDVPAEITQQSDEYFQTISEADRVDTETGNDAVNEATAKATEAKETLTAAQIDQANQDEAERNGAG